MVTARPLSLWRFRYHFRHISFICQQTPSSPLAKLYLSRIKSFASETPPEGIALPETCGRYRIPIDGARVGGLFRHNLAGIIRDTPACFSRAQVDGTGHKSETCALKYIYNCTQAVLVCGRERRIHLTLLVPNPIHSADRSTSDKGQDSPC